jgi:NADPH:quinone reductase-like Zn-dependent oxidoreductase
MTTYGILSNCVFYGRNTFFSKRIRCVENGRGVHVVGNYLAGDSLVTSSELMAPHGRFIELGWADIRGNVNLLMRSFDSNVSFIAVANDYACDHRPALLAKMMRAVIDMTDRGDRRLPSPRRVVSVAQVTDPFRHLQSGASVGKIVLSPGTLEPINSSEGVVYH